MAFALSSHSAKCVALGAKKSSKCSVSGRRAPAGLPRLAPRRLGVQCLASTQPAVDSAASSTDQAVERKQDFEITLKGAEALATVRLGLVPDGQGQAVVVTEVAEGSRAEQLGVRRGQRLLALSDPLRYGQMWSLLDRPSLRFVIDTFKMRRSSPIDLAFEPMLGAADMDAIFGATGATSGPAELLAKQQEAAAEQAANDSAQASISSIDSLLGTSSDEEGSSGGPTMGEKLAAKYEAAQRAQMTVNQVQQRIDRRKAYMEIDDQRDDTKLLLGLAAAFLLPPLVILVIAYFNGYLDSLYLQSITIR